MNEKIINIGNEKIAVYETDRVGKSIFFIHGNSMSSKNYVNQFNSRLKENFHLISFDLPGHGKSSFAENPEETYSLPGYAAITKEIIEELQLDEVILVGYSLGGHICLEAVNNIPQAKGVMIFGAPPGKKPINSDEIFYSIPELGVIFNDEITEDQIKGFINSLIKNKLFTDSTINIVRNADPRVRSYLGLSVSEGRYRDEVQVVKNLEIPLAILHGLEDPLIRLDYIESLTFSTLWKDVIQKLPNVGHSPQIDTPEVFNDILQEFVNDVYKNV